MKKIILLGGGGHCKSCIDVIENENKYRIIGIIDNKKNFLLNYKVFAESYLNNKLIKNNYAIVTVGQIKNYKVRVKLFNTLKHFNKMPRMNLDTALKIYESCINLPSSASYFITK